MKEMVRPEGRNDSANRDTQDIVRREKRRRVDSGWSRYVSGVLLVVAATLLGFPIESFLSPVNLVMLYLVAVVLAAARLGFGPAVLTALMSVLSFDFFFIPPRITLVVADTEYLATFAGFLIVGSVISTLVSEVRAQNRTAQEQEKKTATLYALSRELAAAGDIEAIGSAIEKTIRDVFGWDTVLLLPDDAELLPACGRHSWPTDPELPQAAAWVYENAAPAGLGTSKWAEVTWRFEPLLCPDNAVGVLALEPERPGTALTPEQLQLLGAFVSQVGLAIERELLVDKAQQAELHKATEAFQATLLNSISHDLRTPLASITGALSSLKEDKGSRLVPAQLELVDTAYEEAQRLNHLVGNLLDITRIEGGALRVNWELCDVEDLLGAALAPFNSRLADRQVKVEVPPGMPLVSMDFVLLNQALINVIDNALEHSPEDSPIEVRARLEDEELVIQVLDCGEGIPIQDLDRVFEKFYRVYTYDNLGMGLGLSIAAGFVAAQGGSIAAENRPAGGTLMTVRLPAASLDDQGAHDE